MNSCSLVAAPLILVCWCASAMAGEPGALTLHVATNGNDAWTGRDARPAAAKSIGPFATLARARDEVRELMADPPPGGIVVEIAGGVYQLAEPIEFGSDDSGTETCPIEYRARAGEEVRLVGGQTISGWQRVKDPSVLERLAPAARKKVVQADLRALGVTDLQGINNPRTYQSDPGLELFFDDKPMTLARYPNGGYMKIAEVLDDEGDVIADPQARTTSKTFICDDPRVGRWTGETDVWLHGFWVWDWSDVRVPLGGVDPDRNVVTVGAPIEVRKGQWFYAENVLAELDRPGEWYLDRETAIIYFWPPSRVSAGNAVVSIVRDIIQLTDVSYVTLRGLTVEAGRGTGVTIKGGSRVTIAGCTFRNLGNWAVRVNDGTDHAVVGCDVYQTGQGGIHLEGGDRKTLTPAGHVADNNHIHHIARWDPVYQQAIALFGVGNSATHNLIDNVPHIAIGFSHNEMTIEYNEIHSAVFQSNDAGAIYTSPPDETWSMRGHKIRYNYLHNIHGFEGRGCHGVYLDDCFSSADISGNIFYDVANAILIGGGRDNPMTDNMFINCGRAFHIDARGLGWASAVGNSATQELHALNYTQPPWSTKYPELLGILEDEPLAPKGNVMARNICWGTPWGYTEAKAEPHVTFEDNLIDVDPLFAEPLPASFRLSPDSPANDIGFHHTPFRRIGLYESADRASWPVTSELRRDPKPPAAKPAPVRKAGPPPKFDIPRLTGDVTVDGELTADEWFGLARGDGLVLREGVDGEKCKLQTVAWLAYDSDALYVAFDNAVDADIPMGMGDAWGSNDAVEVSLSNAALGDKAPIIVLRGFACGTFESSQEAGAPPDVANKAAEDVEYAANVIGPDRWVAEMRVPFASLGIDATSGKHFPLSLAVRKQGDDPWVMWRGTGACTWEVSEAGRVRFARGTGEE